MVGVVIGVIMVVGGYASYAKWMKDNAVTRYAIGEVTEGTLVLSMSGSGQVSSSHQFEIKPKAGGDVVYVGVKNGAEVKAGTLLVQLDARDAQKTVRDAEVNLQSARLALQKLLEPADTLSVLQSENALAQAQEAKVSAEDNISKSYEDGFNSVSNAFLDLPAIMSSLQDILFGNTVGKTSQWNIDAYQNEVQKYNEKVKELRDDAYEKYQKAREAYEKNFDKYKATSRFSETKKIESVINETYETVKLIAESTKSATNLIQLYKDELTERNVKPNTIADTHLASLSGYTGKTNSHLLNLLSAKRTIEDSKESLVNAKRAIEERTESLAKLKSGAEALDIESQKLSLKQRENALLDAKEKLADYFIRAPFDGVMAALDVKKGDAVSAGSVLGTLITKQKIAEISLNEVDIAQIKLDQKATLTFDAVQGVTMTGQVVEVDAVGAVSQGVVTYTIKIAFDTEDDRVKPGMSVEAAIVTEVKANTRMVPNSAIKSQNNAKYVEVISEEDKKKLQGEVRNTNSGVELSIPPQRKNVVVGISNDEFSEVMSGLEVGEYVVTRTIQSSSNGNTNQSSPFGIGGSVPVRALR